MNLCQLLALPLPVKSLFLAIGVTKSIIIMNIPSVVERRLEGYFTGGS
jgi:hypothetical protein